MTSWRVRSELRISSMVAEMLAQLPSTCPKSPNCPTGCGSKLNRRVTRVLVHVSTCQGSILVQLSKSPTGLAGKMGEAGSEPSGKRPGLASYETVPNAGHVKQASFAENWHNHISKEFLCSKLLVFGLQGGDGKAVAGWVTFWPTSLRKETCGCSSCRCVFARKGNLTSLQPSLPLPEYACMQTHDRKKENR